MRRWVQSVATLAQNAYLAFPWTLTLYQGPLKKLCTPGLNCYSCPAAVLSCPLGALQQFLAGFRPAWRWGTYHLGFYAAGFLMLVGLMGGRFTCGWLCPFGFLQDGLHRIPSTKFRISPLLGPVRYLVLAVTVIILPLALVKTLGYGEPWFCKALCPAGTLEAGGLLILIPHLRDQIGLLFAVKLCILVATIAWAVLSYRPYCRTLCPLGALYGVFNRWSLIGVDYDPDHCQDCGRCVDHCQVDLDPRRDGSSAACLRCFGCALKNCPSGALRLRSGERTLALGPCNPPTTRIS